MNLWRLTLGWTLVLAVGCLNGPWFLGLAGEAPERPDVKTAKIEFKSEGEERHEVGEIIVEGQDGSMLLQTAEGRLWGLQPSEIIQRDEADQSFQPLTKSQVAAQLKEDLPDGFSVHETAHFVLVYNTSKPYAQWVGDIYERLYKAFHDYWDDTVLKLHEPRFPMVAVVFENQGAYLEFAKPEVGEMAGAMIGYYNMQTNRIVSFDITGIQGMIQPGQRVSSREMLSTLFSQPQAERTVATVVHEAVHQIAYNCGMQVRLADNPKWVSEGMAMFFEVPDGRSTRLWGSVGRVNPYQLVQFGQYLRTRPADSLTTLISDDARFAGEKDRYTAAYAESWALTYFLIKKHKKDYAAYLKDLSELEPLGEPDARRRVETFKTHFGQDLAKLDMEFLRFIRNLK